MAITFTVADEQFKLNKGTAAAVKTWLDSLSITTLHLYKVKMISAARLYILVAYA